MKPILSLHWMKESVVKEEHALLDLKVCKWGKVKKMPEWNYMAKYILQPMVSQIFNRTSM